MTNGSGTAAATTKVVIAGGGIGGLTAALALHQRGIACTVFEQASELRELGVGITLMPHAVRELAALGLLPALDAVAIRSQHLYYMTRRGQMVWDEPRGTSAGHDVPQFFIHRGMLQGVLVEAVRRTLPPGALRVGCRLARFVQDAGGIRVEFVDSGGAATATAQGDVLLGADGIHSAVRGSLRPDEGPPLWSGLMLWRGATDWPAFLGGASLLIAGGVEAKFVAYPIAAGLTPGTRLTNWAAITRLAPFGSTPPRREDWSREGRMADLAPLLERFDLGTIDVKALVGATETFWEYPMCDRDPVERWLEGRVTLLGDAAHPMYPMGANGASQAILDARSFADALADATDVPSALQRYQSERLPSTSDIVRLNRIGGPEAVIDAVEQRAPDGFADVDAVLGRDERQRIVRGYAAKASSTSTPTAA